MLAHAIEIEHENENGSSNKNTNDNMCKNTIVLCISCADTGERWVACEEFSSYKNKFGLENAEPNDNGWIDEHAITNPQKMAITISTTKCPTCKRTNRPKMKTPILVDSVEKIILPLAGTFKLVNGTNNKTMREWTKTIYEPSANEVATDTETESEAGDGDGTETEAE